ncbi:MAG: flagellar hook-length control protein FliK [Nitrospirae bacterium]|nr:flagellar hook-length control protein FliK [Nitrospirota bacterium]MCL5978644.1 flagellar hook-length control protein FliK [Nitrospirota bacterium]
MLNVLMQPNVPNPNAVNAAGNKNQFLTQSVQDNQNGIESGDFVAILSAILSGLNNSIMNAQNGLVLNKDGQQVNIDDLAIDLFAGNDGNTPAGGGLTEILQQLMSQAQIAGIPNAVVVSDNRQPVNEMSNTILQSHNGNVVLTSLMKSEDGMQKIKVHTNISAENNNNNNNGSNDNSDNGLFSVKITTKAMTNGNNEQPVNDVSEKKNMFQFSLKDFKIHTDNVSKGQMQPNLLDTASKGIKGSADANLQLQVVSVESEGIEKAGKKISAGDQSPVDRHPVISSIQNSGDKTSASNSSAKEPVHVSRLHELGEPIAKTFGAGDKHLIIKLDPPDLGSIRIKLTMDNGVLKVDFKVESAAVKDMFSTVMPNIKASLEDSGIKLSEFFVDVKEDRYPDEGRRHHAETGQQQQKQQKEQKFKFYDYFA